MAARQWKAVLAAGMFLAALACGNSPGDGSIVTPPPPPAPVPLALAVAPVGHRVVAQQNTAAQGDSAAVVLSGDGSTATTWSATKRQSWTTLTTASGTGTGMARWIRDISGLEVGVHVDTITVTAPGAIGSPYSLYDTVSISATPVPLALAVAPATTAASVIAGAATGPTGEAAVTITGTGAETVTWSASRRRTHTTLTVAAGTGSGAVRWSRTPGALAVGVYVDTITVTAAGISGSRTVFDTLHVLPVPVPLTLALTPTSRSATVQQGGAAPADSATVTLGGDGAAGTAWTATKRQNWTTLTTAAGTGSGKVRWTRSATGLAAGTYVDTITVTAAGATGSPARLVDTLVVTAVSGGPQADLGLNASLHGKRIFPASDPWNQPVDTAQVDPNSTAILSLIGLTRSFHPDWGPTWGFPYIVVSEPITRYQPTFDYPYESDPGPYPIPANPPIEGGGQGDAHLLVIHRDEWKLYELYLLAPAGGQWTAGSGAIFDMTNGTQRPDGWTSADAAGLPIFPGLVRYDEVYEQGEITHALRMTITHTQHAYIFPATHRASSSTNPLYPPMGMRVRLRADFDISGYPAPMQVILRALKKYGMIVADNGGDFFVSGTIDPRWNDDYDNLLKQVKVGDFEVIKMVGIITQ